MRRARTSGSLHPRKRRASSAPRAGSHKVPPRWGRHDRCGRGYRNGCQTSLIPGGNADGDVGPIVGGDMIAVSKEECQRGSAAQGPTMRAFSGKIQGALARQRVSNRGVCLAGKEVDEDGLAQWRRSFNLSGNDCFGFVAILISYVLLYCIVQYYNKLKTRFG